MGAQASSLPAGGGTPLSLVAVGDRPPRLGRQRLAPLVAVAQLDIGLPRSGAHKPRSRVSHPDQYLHERVLDGRRRPIGLLQSPVSS